MRTLLSRLTRLKPAPWVAWLVLSAMLFLAGSVSFACAPKGAFTLWVEVPPGQWSVGPVAGRRLGWVTGWV